MKVTMYNGLWYPTDHVGRRIGFGWHDRDNAIMAAERHEATAASRATAQQAVRNAR